jgi:hypothetical protein
VGTHGKGGLTGCHDATAVIASARSTARAGKSLRAQLGDWMLYLVDEQGGLKRTELMARARQALDFSDDPTLRELGLDHQPHAGEMVERSIAELFAHDWVVGEELLDITDAGRQHLRRQMRDHTHGWGYTTRHRH